MDGATLEKTIANLKDSLTDAKIKRNLIQIEKDMIHDFYSNTKKEIQEIESEIKNYDTRMEELDDAHSVEIKVYMQKVKHLEYEHKNDCDKVQLGAEKSMKVEHDDHVNTEKKLRKEKEQLKEEYKEIDSANIQHVIDTDRMLDQNLNEVKQHLDIQKEGLIQKYDHKLEKLKEELELRLKVEIHEIEERKNQHINDLMQNHEHAFREMKEYYNDITRENLELIRLHREKLQDINSTIDGNQKAVDEIRIQNENLKKPLAKAIDELDTLRRQMASFAKDEMALSNANARLVVLKKQVIEMKREKVALEEKYKRMEREKEDMYKKFEVAIEQPQSKSEYKNKVLDDKLS